VTKLQVKIGGIPTKNTATTSIGSIFWEPACALAEHELKNTALEKRKFLKKNGHSFVKEFL